MLIENYKTEYRRTLIWNNFNFKKIKTTYANHPGKCEGGRGEEEKANCFSYAVISYQNEIILRRSDWKKYLTRIDEPQKWWNEPSKLI